MPELVCVEKHKQIDEKLCKQEKKLDSQGNRIDKLEQFKSSTETEMRNLIEQIKSLVNTIKWMLIFTITTLVAFFIWYIQGLGVIK